jgi:dihydropteroate synthase
MTIRPQYKLRIGAATARLGVHTIIMGVLNLTPDSFSDGGLYSEPRQAIRRALEMAREGANWIDIGGESTRPGSLPVTIEEELNRVLPVIRGLRRMMPRLPISIDTTKSAVAREALKAGANILNDISGLRFDPQLADVASRSGAPLILMHLRGRPATMQQRPFARSILRSIKQGLNGSIRRALRSGVRRSQLIIDPGLGFGKTRRQNFEIRACLDRLQRFRLPIVIGASRKSFVRAIAAGDGLDSPGLYSRGKTARRSSSAAHSSLASRASLAGLGERGLDFADAATAAAAILAGAHIVRVHSVAAILPAVRIADAILASRTSRGSHF